MSSYQNFLKVMENISPEDRQALLICLVNQTGPVKRTLSSDFGAGGLFNEVNKMLDGISEPTVRAHRTAELLKLLNDMHCMWTLQKPAKAA